MLHPDGLSFISILHQATTGWLHVCPGEDCLLSLFYIKPQLCADAPELKNIVFYLYSTSNHNSMTLYMKRESIVFYLYSTSNHNNHVLRPCALVIVFYLYSTSNHNRRSIKVFSFPLSFISILHQTTTTRLLACRVQNCLLSLFYIKPQLPTATIHDGAIVFYLYSTSNHNYRPPRYTMERLSFISILHQTTTQFNALFNDYNCLLSLFYIKPQLR